MKKGLSKKDVMQVLKLFLVTGKQYEVNRLLKVQSIDASKGKITCIEIIEVE